MENFRLKTLIYIKREEQKKSLSILAEKRDKLLLHYEPNNASEPKKLRKIAEFAESENCDLLIDVYDNVTPDQIECLLGFLSEDSTPTQIVVADSSNGKQQKTETRALLMLQLLTGEKIRGFRNRFRMYPVRLLTSIPDCLYNDALFYTRILICGARAGYKIKNVNLKNYSPETLLPLPQNRFFIIELLKSLRPWPSKRLCKRNFIWHPIKFFKFLLMENATPEGLALAAATGMFLGTLPLVGFHTAAIIYVSIKLRLNKILSVNISHLCMPPFVPFACMEIGYYIRHGKWLSTVSFQTMVEELHLRLLDWLLGALILAPINMIVFAVITYFIAIILQRSVGKT